MATAAVGVTVPSVSAAARVVPVASAVRGRAPELMADVELTAAPLAPRVTIQLLPMATAATVAPAGRVAPEVRVVEPAVRTSVWTAGPDWGSHRDIITFNGAGVVETISVYAATVSDAFEAFDALEALPSRVELWPVTPGFIFDGWFDAKTGGDKITRSDSVNAPTTLYAHWTADGTGDPGNGGTGGADRYVATTGTDTANDCLSVGSPCRTISHALEQVVSPGPVETVHIANGTYDETLSVTKPMTIQGDSQSGVVLNNPSTGDTPTVTVDAGASSTVTLSGMTIRPGAGSSAVVLLAADSIATLSQAIIAPLGGVTTSASGIVAVAGSALTVNDSTVTGLAAAGIAGGFNPTDPASPGAVDLTITDSTISNSKGAGVDLYAGTATIGGSTVSGNRYIGLSGRDSGVTFNVTGTAITDNGTATGGSQSGGVVFQNGGTFDGTDVTVNNNSNGIVLVGGGTLDLAGASVVKGNVGADAADGGDDSGGSAATGGAGILATFQGSGGGHAPLTVSIADTEISGNTVGMAVKDGDATVTDSTIDGNATVGISFESSSDGVTLPTLTVTNSSVTNNGQESTEGSGQPSGGIVSLSPARISVVDGSSVDGNSVGVIATTGSQVAVTDSHVDRNVGGISGSSGTNITVTGGTVADNGVYGIYSDGGGTEATLELDGVAVTDNGLAPTAALPLPGVGVMSVRTTVTGRNLTVDGNAIGILALGALSLTDSSVTGSVAGGSGGVIPSGSGVMAGSGTATVTGSTISGNEANGLWALGGADVTVTTSTIVGNAGLAIASQQPDFEDPDRPAPTLSLLGSTVIDNAGGAVGFAGGLATTVAGSILEAPDGATVCVGSASGSLTDVGYNVSNDDSCGFDSEGTSKVSAGLADTLNPLADNDGPTQTILPKAGSPVIGMIPNGTSDLCPTTDQRGVDSVDGANCNAGSVQGSSTPPVTCNAASFAADFNAAANGTVTLGCCHDRGDGQPAARSRVRRCRHPRPERPRTERHRLKQ